MADSNGSSGGTQQQSSSSPHESRELQEYPPVTSARIKLSDGRHLAYIERGVPKSRANYKIIVVHGFGSSKEMNFPVSQVRIFCCLRCGSLVMSFVCKQELLFVVVIFGFRGFLFVIWRKVTLSALWMSFLLLMGISEIWK